MPRNLRIAYFAHSLRSDWNNGNAHFLRGLMRALGTIGHDVRTYEPRTEWSIENLRTEAKGASSLAEFTSVYPDLQITEYEADDDAEVWQERLRSTDVVILHEWNPPQFAEMLVELRDVCGFRLLFHDTHHRASSSPDEIARFRLREFDGVLAFGRVLEQIYRKRYNIQNVWTLHEAADATVFHPQVNVTHEPEVVWVGNWGEGERSEEISEYLLRPAQALRDVASTTIYGVRYPDEGRRALQEAGVAYGGYLPNLDARRVYAAASATVHVPRQQYSQVMHGIPTIRIFEALACGIPLVSAPWSDSEDLFREGDFLWAGNAEEMTAALRRLLINKSFAAEQAQRGLETVLARHTCVHRAQELTAVCEEILQ